MLGVVAAAGLICAGLLASSFWNSDPTQQWRVEAIGMDSHLRQCLSLDGVIDSDPILLPGHPLFSERSSPDGLSILARSEDSANLVSDCVRAAGGTVDAMGPDRA